MSLYNIWKAFPATELLMTTGYLLQVIGFLWQPGRIGLYQGKIENWVSCWTGVFNISFYFIFTLCTPFLCICKDQFEAKLRFFYAQPDCFDMFQCFEWKNAERIKSFEVFYVFECKLRLTHCVLYINQFRDFQLWIESRKIFGYNS